MPQQNDGSKVPPYPNHSYEALTELSGGQKSLVSIALVLAQVSYNPYSVYIFDEVITIISSLLRSTLLLMKRIQHEL